MKKYLICLVSILNICTIFFLINKEESLFESMRLWIYQATSHSVYLKDDKVFIDNKIFEMRLNKLIKSNWNEKIYTFDYIYYRYLKETNYYEEVEINKIEITFNYKVLIKQKDKKFYVEVGDM